MPLYEYTCDKCGAEQERLPPRPVVPNEDKQSCPNCGQVMRRKWSVFNHTWDTKWNEVMDELYPPLNPTNADRNIY